MEHTSYTYLKGKFQIEQAKCWSTKYIMEHTSYTYLNGKFQIEQAKSFSSKLN